MNEFDHIVREARVIFDFYGMSREKPVIDEILYNSDYVLRHLLSNNQFFYENLKKDIPVLDVTQQVFNDVNQHYSWIVARNQREYIDGQVHNAKIYMDNVFQVIFAKPPDKNTSIENKNKDDNT